MHDLEAVANIALFYFVLPTGIAAGLALASAIRAARTIGQPRIYATAAALSLGAAVAMILTGVVPYVPLALLAILGLGTWAAALTLAPARLLLAEAVTLPLAILAALAWF